MCGISASIGTEGSPHFGSLVHRGPDQEFFGTYDHLAVTFNRLAVTGGIDGQAPVTSADGHWTCFLNGEIYNFKSLSSDLGLGDVKSDTRVVAEGLSRYGLDFLNRIQGMYSLLLVDNQIGSYFVLRDPLGEKPLFYAIQNETIEVSSEFSALLKRLNRRLRLNLGALSDYFRFGYIEEPWTIDEGILAFERGILYELKSEVGIQELKSFGARQEVFPGSMQELVSLLNKEIVPSDVGQAVLLSGGIDSASLLQNLTCEQKESTFALTLSTPGDVSKGEVKSAGKSARKYGVEHQILEWSPTDLAQDLQNLAKDNDQPHSDMSGVAYSKIFQRVKELGKKVAISGHGPDELFWGYEWYNKQLRDGIGLDTDRIFWKTPSDLSTLMDMREIKIEKGNLSKQDPYLQSRNPYQRFRAEIVHSYLSHNALRQSDRLAMRWSVEPRTPYADYRLYLWAQVNANSADDLYKRSFKKVISNNPFNRLNRRAKQGFDIGMMSFLNSQEFSIEFQEVIHSLKNRGLPWPSDFSIRKFGAREKYRLIMLEYWLRQYD